MKVLVVGSGGREHALAWKLAAEDQVTEVFVAPGNAGTAAESGVTNVQIQVGDLEGLADFAEDNSISLTVVGPEAPLVDGIVDFFQSRGLVCFGPSQGAAQLEGSKAFTKAFLARHNIPTAAYEEFTDLDEAVAYIRKRGAPIVVKADGLAAGKGVVVAQTEAEAISAVEDMLSGNRHGQAGHRVVVEEFMVGEEASFICLCDGNSALPFATSQDHKARDEGDQGPNTGGMGAYSPAPVVTAEVHQRVMDQVIAPTLAGMRAEGNPYVGFLYAGLMIDESGEPRVVEFNCRFGDPEAQPVMMRMKSSLAELCLAATSGAMQDTPILFDERPALGVVVAAGGYPDSYAKGDVITGLDKNLVDTKVFHAGTQTKGDDVVTAGGRVLCVVGIGQSLENAQARAYARCETIGWKNRFFRKDIGYRALARD